jgi:lipoprotein-anchoring transpeptidase ErfK/SrfK
MQPRSIFLFLLLAYNISFANGYFIKKPDICDIKIEKNCTNNKQIIRKLQYTLNMDKKLHLKIKVDGKWGKETKNAVKKFQKTHKLKKIDGWVGRETKIALDKVLKRVKKSKNLKITRRLKSHKNFKNYRDFRRYVNLRKSYTIYKNNKLLRVANSRNTKLKVDISEQRIRLYVNGKVALCAPCTTGSRKKFEPNTKTFRNKATPKGIFRIQEKIAYKRSTIFGDYYRNGKRIFHGDRRKYRGSKKGLVYKGALLKNWMRLTSSGIGLHASKYIKRYPATNGCIRLPYYVANIIFKKVRKGTKVIITN